MTKEEIILRIRCRNLPAAPFGERTGVRLGVQQGREEVVGDVSADRDEATFAVPVFVKQSRPSDRPGEDPDFSGPYVQGRRGERFLYLCWGERRDGAAWDGFGRAKLSLKGLGQGLLDTVLRTQEQVEVVLDMTDKAGRPICGTIPENRIFWTRVAV